MAEGTASFKVTLHIEGSENKPEVRRFVLPRKDLSSFQLLKDKLKIVFQSLQSIPFNVMWEDSEEDEVVISSDEELKIALDEMKGDVYRLKIEANIVSDSGGDDVNDSAAHPGVSCDGCNDEIRGYRYKCIQCPDYDLCSACEMKGIHKEHFIIRIPQPISWRPDFGHRLVHHMTKSARKFRSCPASGCGEDRTRGSTHNHRSCHFSNNSRGSRNQARTESFPQFFQYLFRNMWDPNADITGTQDFRAEEEEGVAAAQNETGAAAPDKNTTPKKEDSGHATYLKSIGETVASLLDPLGIDVNIEVETRKDGKVTKCNIKQPENPDLKTSNDNDQPGEPSSSGVSQSAEKEDTTKANSELNTGLSDITVKEEKLLDHHSDNEDWTVVNGEDSSPILQTGKESEASNENGSSTSGPVNEVEDSKLITSPKKVDNGEGENNSASTISYPDLGVLQNQPPLPQNPPSYRTPMGYMTLPQSHPNQFIPGPYPQQVLPPPPLHYYHNAQLQPTRHIQPHIAESLGKMTAMGFSNEGGWITQLLEAVNGDIRKALDILQPIKK